MVLLQPVIRITVKIVRISLLSPVSNVKKTINVITKYYIVR